MGSFDAILAQAGTEFGLNASKTTSLLSGLVSLMNESPGGLGAFIERLRKSGLGDFVSSWMGSGQPRPISSTTLEAALGHDSIDKIASKAGLSFSTAASALAFMLPNLIQRLTPGGIIPTHLPSDLLSYASSATGVVAAGARRAAYATEDAVKKSAALSWLWPLLGILAVLLVGSWVWNSRHSASYAVFNIADQVRLAQSKATAALAALKPGFSAQDLVYAFNLNVINFPSGSAQIPADEAVFLTKAASAIKMAPAGTVLEIDGHTDNTGDPTSNMALSQQRADAVRTFLVQQGANPNALVAKGFGDTKPVASNDSDEGRFRNRRIEFIIVQ